MLTLEIGWDGIIESWEGESGSGQVLIDGDFYQVDDDGVITGRITVH